MVCKMNVNRSFHRMPSVIAPIKKPTDDGKHIQLTTKVQKIVWKNVLIFLILHYIAISAIYQTFRGRIRWLTYLVCYFYSVYCAMGISAGVHRLWAHRSYKAKLPLRIFLMLAQTGSMQDSIYVWVRDHRAHHKFTDTDADPYNATRGFFFSHIGWLMMTKHPDVLSKGKSVDLSDILADPVARFQKKYFIPLGLLMNFVLPIVCLHYCLGETFWNSLSMAVFRYMLELHATWSVNSAAHIWGMRPYDTNITPVENMWVSFATMGEGWHNFHHVFPWDYRAGEILGWRYNFSTIFLNTMGKLGLAYDFKKATPELIEKRCFRTGTLMKEMTHKDSVWGWGDKDMQQDVINSLKVNRLKA